MHSGAVRSTSLFALTISMMTNIIFARQGDPCALLQKRDVTRSKCRTTITGRFEHRPVSMEEAGQNRNNMSHRTSTPTYNNRSYIVHLLSTYVSGTIRRNCRPWMTRSDGFAPSSLDAYRISRHVRRIRRSPMRRDPNQSNRNRSN